VNSQYQTKQLNVTEILGWRSKDAFTWILVMHSSVLQVKTYSLQREATKCEGKSRAFETREHNMFKLLFAIFYLNNLERDSNSISFI
jgi:hypothetical protein